MPNNFQVQRRLDEPLFINENYLTGFEAPQISQASNRQIFPEPLFIKKESFPVQLAKTAFEASGAPFEAVSYPIEKGAERLFGEESIIPSLLGFGAALAIPGPGGKEKAVVKGGEIAPKLFKGFKNLSTKLLERFRGLPEKIKPGKAEEIINIIKKQGLRPVEEEMFRSSMVIEKGEVNLSKTAMKVEEKLVPLAPTPVKSPRWANIGEEFIGEGRYGEIIYQSPIKTSAGDVHFPVRDYPAPSFEGQGYSRAQGFPNYFSHIRYEDMADRKTRKILETQSDLFQKERLESEFDPTFGDVLLPERAGKLAIRKAEIEKLQPYSSNDPLAHLRTFREEVRRAAKDGKDTILIPSGETAMKIEGLGQTNAFTIADRTISLRPEMLKVGMEVNQGANINPWIITDILGDGKFRAVPKRVYEEFRNLRPGVNRANFEETFDISGEVDTQHFVYKLNEEAIPREARKMGLEVEGKVNVDNGDWWKIKIPKERAKMPVEAFGVAPFLFPKKEERKTENKGTYRLFKTR